MDSGGQEKEVYLDYAGAAVTSQSQLQKIFHSMTHGSMALLGNPHSSNGGPASVHASALLEQAKKLVLDHFNCHPDFGYGYGHKHLDIQTNTSHTSDPESSSTQVPAHPGYDVIFTSSATTYVQA